MVGDKKIPLNEGADATINEQKRMIGDLTKHEANVHSVNGLILRDRHTFVKSLLFLFLLLSLHVILVFEYFRVRIHKRHDDGAKDVRKPSDKDTLKKKQMMCAAGLVVRDDCLT